jgi:hypothetical protein
MVPAYRSLRGRRDPARTLSGLRVLDWLQQCWRLGHHPTEDPRLAVDHGGDVASPCSGSSQHLGSSPPPPRMTTSGRDQDWLGSPMRGVRHVPAVPRCGEPGHPRLSAGLGAPYEQPKAPSGAPNVLYIVLDDVGFAGITEAAVGFPNANGHIPAECATVAEALVDQGFSTAAVGKYETKSADHFRLGDRRRPAGCDPRPAALVRHLAGVSRGARERRAASDGTRARVDHAGPVHARLGSPRRARPASLTPVGDTGIEPVTSSV